MGGPGCGWVGTWSLLGSAADHRPALACPNNLCEASPDADYVARLHECGDAERNRRRRRLLPKFFWGKLPALPRLRRRPIFAPCRRTRFLTAKFDLFESGGGRISRENKHEVTDAGDKSRRLLRTRWRGVRKNSSPSPGSRSYLNCPVARNASARLSWTAAVDIFELPKNRRQVAR